MTWICRLAAVVLIAVSAPAHAQDEWEFSGTYYVDGENPGGNGYYDGQVNIYRTGDTYRMEWYIGNQTFIGTGISYGYVLAVGYDGGTALYEAQDDGTLYGVWAPSEGQQLGRETLTPIYGE